jgi:hypothetical protein
VIARVVSRGFMRLIVALMLGVLVAETPRGTPIASDYPEPNRRACFLWASNRVVSRDSRAVCCSSAWDSAGLRRWPCSPRWPPTPTQTVGAQATRTTPAGHVFSATARAVPRGNVGPCGQLLQMAQGGQYTPNPLDNQAFLWGCQGAKQDFGMPLP